MTNRRMTTDRFEMTYSFLRIVWGLRFAAGLTVDALRCFAANWASVEAEIELQVAV